MAAGRSGLSDGRLGGSELLAMYINNDSGLNRKDLDDAFVQHRQELLATLKNDCPLATLHLICSLPDVCAALQSPDGRTNRQLYEAWCRGHFPRHAQLEPTDRYKIRCAVLHQGSSLPTDQKGTRSQYSSVSFMTPAYTIPEAHLKVREASDGGKNLALDISEVADGHQPCFGRGRHSTVDQSRGK